MIKPCEYITGHTDGSIKLWNVQRVNNQHKFVLKTSIMAHPVAVTALHIPIDGKRLYSGDQNGSIFQFFDASSETKANFV